MANYILPGFLGLIICLNSVVYTEAASSSSSSSSAATTSADFGFVSFPAQAQTCTCSISLSCSCCQSVVVNAMNMTKTLCLTFKLTILSVSVDVSVTLDGTSVAKFTIDAKNPPTFCLPVISLSPVDMCLKLSASLVGLSGIKMCPTVYSTVSGSQALSYAFPCVKLSTDGVSLA
ncbi:uncharacterized protein Dwil_GK13931 [Drosophila willistoni]|uniref:DUF4773 domain-containing protein n=1 Tax=Drosophila willistoni TaxID=7260 RepID=B4NKA9_DROWI|nr:uncharacterized protein LOC6651110 [Drosophila willistoni]EDW84039.1 uncharacterized protein Dwil_GK13931 [Drosophila willistoni]